MKDFAELPTQSWTSCDDVATNLKSNEANVENIAVLDVMNATSNSNDAVSKLVKIWENKNAQRALRGAGLSTMAVTLAACGGGSSTTTSSGGTTPVAGGNFALTDGLDINPGPATANNDSFSGNATTLNAGDSISGGAGDDLLAIFSTAATTFAGFSTNGVETISVSASGGAATVNVANVTGEETFKVNGSSQNVTFTGADTLVELELASNTAGDATVTYNAATVEGTADAMTLTTSATVNGTVTLAGIETLTVANSGTTTIAALTTAAATTLNVSGTGDLTLTNIDDVTTTVNTTHSGELTIGGFGAVDVDYNGGAGVDNINFTGLDDGDNIDGGAGDDTLQLTFATNAVATSTTDGDITVANIETLELVSDGNGDAVDFDIFSAPAFANILVTSTADTDDVTLTDTVSSNFTLRNTNNGTAANDIDFLTIDLKDSTGTADAVTLNLVNRDVNEAMTIATLTGAGIETLTLTADATTLTGAAGDISVTAFTFAALEAITISGDADLTLPAFATGVVTANAAAATGDMSLTFAGGDVTVTGGAGADTFAFGTSLNDDDTIVGGDGTDTVTVGAVNAAAVNIDLNFTGVERLTFTEAEASEGNATFDFNGRTIDRITATAEEDADNVILFDDIGGSSLDLFIAGSGEADGDTIRVELDTDGAADSIDVTITGAAAGTFEGTLTINDFETIVVDTTATAAETGVTLADIDASDADRVTFTNDDAWDDGDVFVLTANSIATGAVIDFSGYNQSIGNAAALVDVAGADGVANTTGAIASLAVAMGTAGFTATATASVTILLGDGRTENADVETSINLGTNNTGADVIRFVDSVDDATDDIGVVVINNFNEAANTVAANRTVIDVSAFGIDALGDMTFTAGETDDAADLTVITSTEFAGSITLLGVVSTDLAAADFIFA